MFPSKAREIHFEQATVFQRDPETTIKDMKKRRDNPILKGKIKTRTKHEKDIFDRPIEHVQSGI